MDAKYINTQHIEKNQRKELNKKYEVKNKNT